jgi:hypothetical protein
MPLYSELAGWFHLLTAPGEYAGEAAEYARFIRDACPGARTLLELGSGGGNNASHLKAWFSCTLTDVSPPMLEVSRRLNPECEHVAGDMRRLRLGRSFDAVFVHDAVMYLTRERDLRAAAETAWVHTRPGGVALFVPDFVREGFEPAVDCGGHDEPGGRSLRYLEWSHDPDPLDTEAEVDYAILMREPGRPVVVEHHHHAFGLFPRDTWLAVLRSVGFEARAEPNAHAGSAPLFVARRPAGGAGPALDSRG